MKTYVRAFVLGAVLASFISPSDAELGFKPSSAPPLDPTVSQFVAAPIIDRYRSTAAQAGLTTNAPTARASERTAVVSTPTAATSAMPTDGVRHHPAETAVAMGGPEKMEGNVIANLDAVPQTARPRSVQSGAVAVIRSRQFVGHLVVPVDQSRILRTERVFGELNVGNREIAEVQPLSNNRVYVLGKKIGTTNLTLLDASGGVIAVVDVEVSYNVDGLSRQIGEIFPTERVRVRPSGDSIALSGEVSSADRLKQILNLAERYAPGKVANLLALTGTQQVLIEVKFAEVERSAVKQLGVSALFQYQNGNDLAGIANSAANAVSPLGALSGVYNHGNFNLKAELDALQKEGLVHTLAEPNLVALSGDTASFLAGGEVPIPALSGAQGTTNGVQQVTLEYKKYGVGLAFTPTVVGKELVNLAIDSEVSSIDDSKSFKAGGYDIPALKIRKAKTTVELQDGQSFAIAGLLQDSFSNGTQRYPGLGDVPVLGALFRSVNYQRAQSDLVLIITVHLVKPTTADKLATPLDTLKVPTGGEHVTTGNVESSADAQPKSAQ